MELLDEKDVKPCLANDFKETDTKPLIKSSAEILNELFSTFNAEPPKLEDILFDKSHKKHKKSKKKHKKKHKKKSKKDGSSDSSSEESCTNENVSHKHKRKKKHKRKRHRTDSESSYDSDDHSIAKKHVKLERSEMKNPVDFNFVFNSLSDDLKLSLQTDKSMSNIMDSIEKESMKNIQESEAFERSSTPQNFEENNLASNSLDANENKFRSYTPERKDPNTKKSGKIEIKNLKHSSVYEATVKEIEEQKRKKLERIEEGEISDSNSSKSTDNDKDLDLNTSDEENFKNSEKEKKELNFKSNSQRKDRQRSGSSSSKKHDYDSERNKDKEKTYSEKEKSDHDHRSRSKHRESHSEKSRHSSRHKYKIESGESRHRHHEKEDISSSRSHRSIKDRLGRKHDRVQDRYSSNRRSRSRDRRNRTRSRSASRERFDKKKLLEIARKNAIHMLKNGTLPGAVGLGPQAQEKVLAAIKAGGKSINELTDFCKNLSKKEAMGELESVSSGEEVDSSGEPERAFNHPFQLKERPTSIIMNIPNSTVIPIKSATDKSDKSVLSMQFPVSSGQHHRRTENEWVPVSPKQDPPTPKPEKINTKPTATQSFVAGPPLAIMPATATTNTITTPEQPAPVPPPEQSTVEATVSEEPLPVPGPQVMPPLSSNPTVFTSSSVENIDIGSIVSQRLTAMRKLQENPNDAQALSIMYKSQQEMQTWVASKQVLGQFTGSTGAHILSPAELSSGYQAWARKDQLQTATPVSGGMGMHLLQKMGWRPGEGLGREKNGALQPLMLEVKLDKKGLVATEEMKGPRNPHMKRAMPVKTLQGKHPVSLLGEYATKKKLGVPQYDCCFECGPPHKKNFLFKVRLNGMEYQPSVASPNKKQAKADAAILCLQQLGVIPS